VERISFHGMLALLTLYMAEQLFLPGHARAVVGLALRAAIESLTGPLSVEALAAQVFGLCGPHLFHPGLWRDHRRPLAGAATFGPCSAPC
jgi:hypothetical protein